MTNESLPSRIERLRADATFWTKDATKPTGNRICDVLIDAMSVVDAMEGENVELRRRLAVAREAVLFYGPAGEEFDWGDGLKDRALDATNLEKPFKEGEDMEQRTKGTSTKERP